MWSQGQSHGAPLRGRGEGRRSGTPGVRSPAGARDDNSLRGAGGREISSVPPFHLPVVAGGLRGLHQPGGANKRRKLSLSASRKAKDAEELRLRNAQKLLAQSIESEDDDEEDDDDNDNDNDVLAAARRTSNSDDDHKPASGKPSLEDVGSYSPNFAPVHLGDSELILSQAEEDDAPKDKAVRAASQAGAATGWDSDDKWWYLAAEDIVQLSAAAPADGGPESRPASRSGSQHGRSRQPAPVIRECVDDARDGGQTARNASTPRPNAKDVNLDEPSDDDDDEASPLRSFSPVIVPTGRVRMEDTSPTPATATASSPPSSSFFFPASQPFPPNAPRPLLLSPNESPIRPISRSEVDRVLGPSDDDDERVDGGEQSGGEDEDGEARGSASSSTSASSSGRKGAFSVTAKERRKVRAQRRALSGMDQRRSSSSSSPGGKNAPALRKVSVIVEENGQMVEVIGSEGARPHRAASRDRQAQHRTPPGGDEDDSQDDDGQDEAEGERDGDDGDDEAADADADAAAASDLESEKKKPTSATRRTLFDGDNDEEEEEDDGGANSTWLRRRFKNPAAAARLSRSEFRELCRGKPASSPGMLITAAATTRGASSKASKESDGDEDTKVREKDEPPTTTSVRRDASAEKHGVVSTSILPLPSLPSFPSSSSLTEIEDAGQAPVVVKQRTTTTTAEPTRTPTRERTTGGPKEGSSPGQRPNHASKAPPAAPSPLAMTRPSQELSEEPFTHSSRTQRTKRQRETDERTAATAAKPMLAGLHFILTGLNEERPDVDASTSVTTSPARLPPRVMQEAEVKELIEDLGGTVINRMAHLRQQDRLAGSRGFVWRSAWGDLPSVILISDKHHRTLKYLMALAAGIPTIHYRWLLHSTEQGCPLPYRPYLLPAGVSLIDEKRLFHHESWPMAVFAGVQIRLLGSRQFMKYWRLVLEEAGAEVDAVEPAYDEAKAATPDGKKKKGQRKQQQHKQADKRPPPSLCCTVAEKESYVDVGKIAPPNKATSPRIAKRQPQHGATEENRGDDGKGDDAAAVKQRDEPICTIEWVVQSLICRERLDFAAHPLFCYASASSTTTEADQAHQ